jgi:hypothetical protein
LFARGWLTFFLLKISSSAVLLGNGNSTMPALLVDLGISWQSESVADFRADFRLVWTGVVVCVKLTRSVHSSYLLKTSQTTLDKKYSMSNSDYLRYLGLLGPDRNVCRTCWRSLRL